MKTFVTNFAILLAAVGTTGAATISKRVSLNGLSSQCQNALFGVASNPDASSCLNIQGLVSGILTSQGNSSVVPAINSWAQGLCAANACSNATISAIASNLTSGCQSDISSSNGGLGGVIQALPTAYPTLRQILCLESTSNDTLCISNTLLGFQDMQGSPLSLSSATGAITQVIGQASNNSLPSNVLCTECNQRALQIVAQNDPSIGSNQQFQQTIARQCGSGFLNATPPTAVAEATGTSAPTGTLPPHLISNGGNSSSNSNNNSGAVAAFTGIFLSTSVALFAGLYTISA